MKKELMFNECDRNRTSPARKTMIRASHFCLLSLMTAGATGLVGCGPHLRAPTYDPEAMAREAFRLFDANKDGKLDATELKQCPSLADALPSLDANNDKCIDESELVTALRALVLRNALNNIEITVTRHGKAVPGATVRLIPEAFLANAVQPASGVTNPQGIVRPKIEGQDLPGVHGGFYRAEITSDGETIPARYNTQTTLGKMIGHRWHGWVIELD
jgi:EF-hand domain